MAATALAGTLPQVALAKGKHHHKSGKDLLGDKIKSNGNHVIDKNGPHTVSVDVRDGKIAGMHVKHATKGELPVKKYKTSKKMAAAEAQDGFMRVGYMQVQQTYVGTTYIGYSYYDEYGDEVIYWYPYDMIYDADTGAVEYVPV
jgi:hypothetical protein